MGIDIVQGTGALTAQCLHRIWSLMVPIQVLQKQFEYQVLHKTGLKVLVEVGTRKSSQSTQYSTLECRAECIRLPSLDDPQNATHESELQYQYHLLGLTQPMLSVIQTWPSIAFCKAGDDTLLLKERSDKHDSQQGEDQEKVTCKQGALSQDLQKEAVADQDQEPLPEHTFAQAKASGMHPSSKLVLLREEPLLIPRAFLESNFDMAAASKHGLLLQTKTSEGGVRGPAVKVDVVLVPGLHEEDGTTSEPMCYAVPWEQVDAVTREFHGHEVESWRKSGDNVAQMIVGGKIEGSCGLSTTSGPPQLERAESSALAGQNTPTPQQGSNKWDQAASMSDLWAAHGARRLNYFRLMGGGAQLPLTANGAVYERMGRSTSSVILHQTPGTELPSPPPGAVQHRSKKQSVSLISPNHFIHIPRHFFQGNYDIPAILRSGLRVQIEANGQVEPDTILTTVANYQNNSGYSYYRLLGFKPVCRRYSGWKVDGWQKVDDNTVRLSVRGPYQDSPDGQVAVGQQPEHFLPPSSSFHSDNSIDASGGRRAGAGVGPARGLLSSAGQRQYAGGGIPPVGMEAYGNSGLSPSNQRMVAGSSTQPPLLLSSALPLAGGPAMPLLQGQQLQGPLPRPVAAPMGRGRTPASTITTAVAPAAAQNHGGPAPPRPPQAPVNHPHPSPQKLCPDLQQGQSLAAAASAMMELSTPKAPPSPSHPGLRRLSSNTAPSAAPTAFIALAHPGGGTGDRSSAPAQSVLAPKRTSDPPLTASDAPQPKKQRVADSKEHPPLQVPPVGATVMATAAATPIADAARPFPPCRGPQTPILLTDPAPQLGPPPGASPLQGAAVQACRSHMAQVFVKLEQQHRQQHQLHQYQHHHHQRQQHQGSGHTPHLDLTSPAPTSNPHAPPKMHPELGSASPSEEAAPTPGYSAAPNGGMPEQYVLVQTGQGLMLVPTSSIMHVAPQQLPPQLQPQPLAAPSHTLIYGGGAPPPDAATQLVMRKEGPVGLQPVRHQPHQPPQQLAPLSMPGRLGLPQALVPQQPRLIWCQPPVHAPQYQAVLREGAPVASPPQPDSTTWLSGPPVRPFM